MVEAVVEFDYTAQESDELTIRKGDYITDVKIQPGGWWEGSLGAKRGMFPDNFVKLITPMDSSGDKVTMQSNVVTLRPKSGRCCKVLFSYQPVNEDELQLQVDDVIDVICEVEDGWWKGRLRDMVGMFPSNFVSEILGEEAQRPRPSSRDEASESDGDRSTSVSSPDSSVLLDSVGKTGQPADLPLLPPKPVKEQCRALFAYEAANNDELTLKEGDIVTLLSREVQDKGWWRGELKGRVGLFPDNFVEVISGAQAAEEQPPKKPERFSAKAQLVTTNRARDTITKPPGGVKGDVPPVPGKKPQLPAKKTERLSTAGADQSDGAGPSRVSRSMDPPPPAVPTTAVPSEVVEFDSVERSAMLTHPTASRARAPGRRLPSSSFVKEAEPSVPAPTPGLTNGTEGAHEDSARKLQWEKGKAPWMEELKLNQARKSVQVEPSRGPPSRGNVRPQSMYGDLGNPPGPGVASPPVKLSRLVPMPKTDFEPATVAPPTEPPPVVVPDANSVSITKRSKENVPAVPLAKANSFRSSESSGVVAATPQAKRDSAVGPAKMNLNNAKVCAEEVVANVNNGLDVETLATRLRDVEQQQRVFTRAIKELTQKLDEETQKRIQIEQQLNKLTDLVTQV